MKEKQSDKFTHPTHARGVRSPDFTRGLVGAILTDSRIHHYALLGRYGSEIQHEAELIEQRKSEARQKQRINESAQRALSKLLGI